MTTALEHDILAELEHRDLEVQQLRAELYNRGHHLSTVGLYERLVHLEAGNLVRVNVRAEARTWKAM